ncbi:AAA family ATPase [Deltaproteobacteria bacterium IMCC39524]|nr:AAA family ATPase [Deltaproteobacteria bacterium IMCC39524]
MLKKIHFIRNVGKFHAYEARGDLQLKKYNLIFGPNGLGKTTICSILRSLQEDNPEILLERKTIGSDAPPSARIEHVDGACKFKDGAWDAAYPDLAIFDISFVHNNVYIGDAVTTDHRRNLYRVIVGHDGVQLAHAVEEADTAITTAQTQLNTKQATAKGYIPKELQGLTLDNFVALSKDDDVDEKITNKEEEIRILNDSEKIKTTSKMRELKDLPKLPTDFADTLSNTVEGVIGDAENIVRQHLEKHGLEEEGWLQTGLDHVVQDSCPFCAQDVKVNDMVSAYRTYFNQAYQDHKDIVNSLTQDVSTDLADQLIFEVQQVIQSNEKLWEYWSAFVKEEECPQVDFKKAIYTPLVALRDAAISLAKAKQQKPLDKIELDSVFLAAEKAVSATQDVVTNYNLKINELNQLIDGKKQAVSTGNLDNEVVALKVLKLQKARYEVGATTACTEYTEALQEKRDCDRAKITAKQALDDYDEDILSNYEKRINELLGWFGTGFRIRDTKKDYVGRLPRSTYQIEINGSVISLEGDRGAPSFKNTLSSGDKSALAFAFFIAQIESDSRLTEKVIVFDDPFTSQDRFRRNYTCTLIKEMGQKAKQVIVFSHDPLFLHNVNQRIAGLGGCSKLQLTSAGQDAPSTINQWDIDEEIKAGYFKDHEALVEYARMRSGDPKEIKSKTRTVLESWFKYRFPGQFQETDTLGGMIRKIESADVDSPLAHVSELVADLNSLNEYSRESHHGLAGEPDTTPIDENELSAYVGQTLSIVGGY